MTTKNSVPSLLLSLLLPWLGACAMIVGSATTTAPGAESVTLTSARLTRQGEAQLTLNCGASIYWQNHTSRPGVKSAKWQRCPNRYENFETTIALEDGANEINLWFKTVSDDVSEHALTIGPIVKSEVVDLDDPTPGDYEGDDYSGCNNHCYAAFAGAYGGMTVALAGGNVVAADPQDSQAGAQAGAVHLYNGVTGALIRSYRGATAGDRFGSQGIAAIPNGNFVILSSETTVAAKALAGTATYVNGSTGDIIATFQGATANDQLGSKGVVVLSSGNFLLQSSNERVGALAAAGTVRLISSATGSVIATIAGDDANDALGAYPATELTNGNFVLRVPSDDVGGLANAGSLKVVNGSTGAVIATVAGDNADDSYGFNEIYVLSNGNFVAPNVQADDGGVSAVGVTLVISGEDGTVLATFKGDDANDSHGYSGVKELASGNLVIWSTADDIGGQVNAGSMQIIDGDDFSVLNTLSGAVADDQYGSQGVTELSNGNFTVASPLLDIGGVSNAGRVSLVNGSTGQVIGSTSGTAANNSIGWSVMEVGTLSHYAIFSDTDDLGGLANVGSITIVNGEDATTINKIMGDQAADQLGRNAGQKITLPNGNFAVANDYDTVGGNARAGSVMIINGNTGALVHTLSGGHANDEYGGGGLHVLGEDFLLVRSPSDDEGGVANVGSIKVYRHATAALVTQQVGALTSDMLGAGAVLSLANGNLVAASANESHAGSAYTGSLRVFSAETAELLSTFYGNAYAQVGYDTSIGTADSSIVALMPFDDNHGFTDSGRIALLPGD